jgi:hypothetical protein
MRMEADIATVDCSVYGNINTMEDSVFSLFSTLLSSPPSLLQPACVVVPTIDGGKVFVCAFSLHHVLRDESRKRHFHSRNFP